MTTDSLLVPTSGDFGDETKRTIPRKRQTKFYYLMAIDCKNKLWTKFPNLPKIEVEVSALNAGS